MSDTSSIFKDIKGFKIPPIDNWHPDKVVDFDIRIDCQGKWYHEGDLIMRRRLVKLFASVLRREDDGFYYLVTPATKYRIRVDDAPFIIVQMHVENAGTDKQNVYFRTNMDDEIRLDKQHDMHVYDYVDCRAGTLKLPYVYIRQGLRARLSRQVFFEFVNFLIPHSEYHFSIISASETFDFLL